MLVTKEGFILTEQEKEAVKEANEIMAEKYASIGENFDQAMQEAVTYWLYGALSIVGVNRMLKMVRCVDVNLLSKGGSRNEKLSDK